MTDKTDKSTSDGDKKSKDQKGYRQQKWQKGKRHDYNPKKKDPEEIPILKYGPTGNFAKFKEAISKRALRDYGHLGKLIETGDYYRPEMPDTVDYDFVNDPYGLSKALFMEAMKDYRKEIAKMVADRPKLYALILQYLSEESLDEVKRSDKWEDIKKSTEPRDLWNQGMRQGPYETIIQYKERFDNAKKSYEEQGNPPMEDVDVAMDFFKGLDNNRYGNFKTKTMNDLTAKILVQPQNLNEMYLLASQFVQLKTTTNAMGQVNAVQQSIFGPNDVLLDNQADVSIVRQELLRDIQDAEHAVKINGVGGHQFTVNKTGYLDPLFRVYASETTHANILSLSEAAPAA